MTTSHLAATFGRSSLLLDLFTFRVAEVLAFGMRRTNREMIPSSAATSPTLVTGVEFFFAAVHFHWSPQSRFRLAHDLAASSVGWKSPKPTPCLVGDASFIVVLPLARVISHDVRLDGQP